MCTGARRRCERQLESQRPPASPALQILGIGERRVTFLRFASLSFWGRPAAREDLEKMRREPTQHVFQLLVLLMSLLSCIFHPSRSFSSALLHFNLIKQVVLIIHLSL